MANETMSKFNYPATLLREYKSWVVLLRPQQVTAGSLVLVSKLDATAVGQVPPEAFAELSDVTRDLEATLQVQFRYDKINYLLLMMVDKHVHFHVLPRYKSERLVAGVRFEDSSWPKPPDLSKTVDVTPAAFYEMLGQIKRNWQGSAGTAG